MCWHLGAQALNPLVLHLRWITGSHYKSAERSGVQQERLVLVSSAVRNTNDICSCIPRRVYPVCEDETAMIRIQIDLMEKGKQLLV
jgi:hypothetical protein